MSRTVRAWRRRPHELSSSASDGVHTPGQVPWRRLKSCSVQGDKKAVLLQLFSDRVDYVFGQTSRQISCDSTLLLETRLVHLLFSLPMSRERRARPPLIYTFVIASFFSRPELAFRSSHCPQAAPPVHPNLFLIVQVRCCICASRLPGGPRGQGAVYTEVGCCCSQHA